MKIPLNEYLAAFAFAFLTGGGCLFLGYIGGLFSFLLALIGVGLLAGSIRMGKRGLLWGAACLLPLGLLFLSDALFK